VDNAAPMMRTPLGIINDRVFNFLKTPAFGFHWNSQPDRAIGGFYLVAISPIPPRVLPIIKQNEFIDAPNQIKIASPRYVIRLNDSYRFAHATSSRYHLST
jgi:hypothetical protein